MPDAAGGPREGEGAELRAERQRLAGLATEEDRVLERVAWVKGIHIIPDEGLRPASLSYQTVSEYRATAESLIDTLLAALAAQLEEGLDPNVRLIRQARWEECVDCRSVVRALFPAPAPGPQGVAGE